MCIYIQVISVYLYLFHSLSKALVHALRQLRNFTTPKTLRNSGATMSFRIPNAVVLTPLAISTC